ncbi:MAG TPA: DNA-3-methyladenine glycosylase 2 family protein [Candidatus Limnocylindria bacterium]|nr:DNA-3-methyladenine glycosylase 2 family protein [Candidatus Limnocylindria bacterium]
MTASRFAIGPDAPFSLAAAASFGFGPDTGRPKPDGDLMRLAFVVDGYREHAGVVLRQQGDTILASVEGARGAVVERQVLRVLSLDRPARDWLAVGTRDSVIGRLQREHPGLRPVLFHSPYEAAAWSVISARKPRAYASALRSNLAAAHGRIFELAGEELAAFPLPEKLAALRAFPGLDTTRMTRLRAIARAALDGLLDASRLVALSPETARAELETLPGIGPFYADLVLVRGTGLADLLPRNEPMLLSYVGHFYGKGGAVDMATLETIAERWKPFRTWATVLIRVAGDRAGLPVEQRGPRRGARSQP